jgi:hypothetical protein
MRFKPNPALVTELEAEPVMEALLDAKADEAKREAESVAPDHTGYYHERFTLSKIGNRRRLGNTDPFAHLVEWGSIHNPAYSPLRRGVTAAGLHLREN